MSDQKTEAEPSEDAELEQLLHFIRDARGFDFTGYKRTSLARRIRKRMEEVGMDTWVDYRDRLETNADEFRFLFNTILINVTSFFRDADAWRYLQAEVVPEILAQSKASDEIRIWSAGCSSGEEAYSLAILFAEAIGLDEAVERVKIYGTDVDEEALREARSGTYSAKGLAHLETELRDRYFEKSGVVFTFRPDLRRRVIFGRHDITRDAPISHLDLLVCRNTLMYFNVEAQNQIIDRLHFALREGGFLFLGKAEMLMADGGRFEAANMRQRMFRRLPGATATAGTPAHLRLEPLPVTELRSSSRKRQVRELMVEATPYAMIGLDSDGILVAASAEARSEFGIGVHDIGRPFRDHELSYRPVELRSLIDQAQHEHRTVRVSHVERRAPGSNDRQYLDVVVQPLHGNDGMSVGTGISFIDVSVATRLHAELKRVREDLETAYEELQSTNEELETTNEELQSSIEELETTNEELQSTNEELETTNEELQSGNEELETMNEEMRLRSDELDEARTFLGTVVSSLGAAVVVLDEHLRVQEWNRGAEDLWGLRVDEVKGEGFFGLEFGLDVNSLRDLVQECMSTGHRTGPVTQAAVNRTGRSITCRVTCSPLVGELSGAVLLMEQDRHEQEP